MIVFLYICTINNWKKILSTYIWKVLLFLHYYQNKCMFAYIYYVFAFMRKFINIFIHIYVYLRFRIIISHLNVFNKYFWKKNWLKNMNTQNESLSKAKSLLKWNNGYGSWTQWSCSNLFILQYLKRFDCCVFLPI